MPVSRDTGERDGRLPVAGLLEQVPENWPTIFQRLDWVNYVAQAFELSCQETMILIRIVRRAGNRSQACWESQDTMAREGRMHRVTAGKALTRLRDLGLIHKVARYHDAGHSDAHVPIFETAHLQPTATNEVRAQNTPTHGPICSPELHHLQPTTPQKKVKGISDLDIEGSGNSKNAENEGVSINVSNSFHMQPTATNGADITECEVCGLPWTVDPLRHRRGIRRGLRDFICNECWDAQVSVAQEGQQN